MFLPTRSIIQAEKLMERLQLLREPLQDAWKSGRVHPQRTGQPIHVTDVLVAGVADQLPSNQVVGKMDDVNQPREPHGRRHRVRSLMVKPDAFDDRLRKLPPGDQTLARHGVIQSEDLLLDVADANMLTLDAFHDAGVALRQTCFEGNLADIM